MGLDAGKVVAYLMLDTSKFESGIMTGRSLMKTLQSDSASTAKKALAIGDAMASTGKIMTLGLTAPIVGLGAAATKTFVSFDDAIRQVTATMEASEEETKRLTEAAQEVGLTTQFSATKAAEALNSLAAAGYDAEGAIAALPTVLKLSAAAGVDLGAASDKLTGSMAALGLGVGDMERYVDQLAKGASVSNASIAQLGEAILTVGGTAKILKGGTVELNAELGILANNGLKGAEGGTMLRNVINALSAPTDTAAKSMKKYRLEAFDAQGQFRGLNDIFTDLDKIMNGWSDQKRADLMSELFNVRDLKAAEALMAGTTGLYEEFASEIENSDGAAQRFADTLSGGLSGATDRLQAAVEGLAIEFGEDLAPTVQDVTEWVTNLTRNWAAMDEGTQQTIITVAKWVAGTGPALIVLGKLVTGVTALTTAMCGPAGWITLGVAGVAALSGALALLPPQMDAVDAALANVDPEKLAAFKKGLNSVDVDVTVKANAKVDAGSIYDQVYAALTDGKPDTAQQTKDLTGQVQGYYDALVKDINLNTETQLAGLKEQLESGFITLEEYQTRADAITTENGALVLSVQQTCTDSLAYVNEMSGKSTATVQGSLDELEALKSRAEETAAAVAKLLQETESQEAQRAQRLVKSGAKTDEETTGLAFTTAKNQYKLDVYDAEQNAAGRRKGSDQRFDEAAQGKTGDDLADLKKAHDLEVVQIEADLAADKARVQAAFLQNLNELFVGLSGQNPELQAQLAGAFEKLDLAAALQDALNKGGPEGAVENTALMERLGKMMGIDDPSTYFKKLLEAGGPAEVQSEFQFYMGQLVESAGKETAGLDTSPMATAMQGLIEEGLLAGFNYDAASMRDKLALALGEMNLPQAIADAMTQPTTTGGGAEGGTGTLEVPLTVAPKPTVEEGAAEKVQGVLSDSLSGGSAEGEGSGTSGLVVEAPVTVSPVPVAEEGSDQKLVDTIAGAITDAVGSVKTAGSTISKAAATAFGSEVASAKLAGVNMVQGLIDGVTSKRQSVITTFEGIIVAAVQAAKRKAGIASPSKVFRGIGHNIADSFSLGVDDRLLSSQRTVEKLVGVPAGASKSTQRAAAQVIDYAKLADAVASRPVNLNLDGKTFAQATAADNTRAVAERQRRLDIGKGLV